jgi:hypothetical protein
MLRGNGHAFPHRFSVISSTHVHHWFVIAITDHDVSANFFHCHPVLLVGHLICMSSSLVCHRPPQIKTPPPTSSIIFLECAGELRIFILQREKGSAPYMSITTSLQAET